MRDYEMSKTNKCSMQLLVSKNAYEKLQIINRISEINKNDTCTRLIIFNQIEYYKNNEGDFKRKIKSIRIIKREPDTAKAINLSFPENIKNELEEIKKSCYPYGLHKSVSDRDFVYKIFLMGLNNIMPNEKYFRDNSERLAENIHTEYEVFIKKLKKIKNPGFDEKDQLAISMKDTVKWKLMMIAFEIEVDGVTT